MNRPRLKMREVIGILLLAPLHKSVEQQNIPTPTTGRSGHDIRGYRMTLSIADQYFYLKRIIGIRMRKEVYLQHMNILHHQLQSFDQHCLD